MRPLSALALSVASIVVVIACGSSSSNPDDPPSDCTPSETAACACSNGTQGTRTCLDSRSFGDCRCAGSNPPPGPDGAAPGADSGCKLVGPYFRDADGDGYGADPAVSVCDDGTGGIPAGYVALGGDCDDADERAFPGQLTPQEGTRKGVGGGDFDCNDVETKTHTKVGGCSCPGWQEGFIGSVAACGATGSWMDFCSLAGGGLCNQTVVQRAQTCL